MDRKQININILLNKLNSKIEEVQNNQKNLENTIENIINDMNLIRDRQNNIEKEINSIKSIQSKYKTKNNVESDDYKKIKAISDKIFENFEKIKNERISYSKIEQKVEELNKRNDENKNIINNQKNMIDELNNRVSNCKNTLEEKSKEKIESAINLILSIKKQNETLTKKMNDNEKKIKKLQMKLEKEVFKKDKGKRPNNYKLEKNISSDLFEKKNYDNKSACIFNYNEDDNIYVVYGVKTFDLECYDIQNDNKFIIIKKLHGDLFYSCRHFFNEERYQDLIITSSFDRHVKVTNFKKEKSEVILDLNLEENQKPINTAYFSHDYIIVPFSDDSEGSVQIYSMDPYLIEEFEDNSGFILGLTTYFCEKRDQNFILVSNRKGILSYIIDKFYLFQKYSPGYSSKEIMDNEIIDENGFSEAYVIEENDNLILVGPSFNQGLYFWDFISGDLISKMDIMGINNICLWNNEFILASVNKSELCEFILIDAYNKKIDKKIGGGMTDQIGCGIQLLRNLSKGNFLISFSNKGELKLYTLESK
jgi:WD40 repeat protein